MDGKPMDGKPSAGSCGVCDPLFVPIETCFGARPAKTVCCCGTDLRKVGEV